MKNITFFRKSSITMMITAVCLGITALTTLTLSTVFINNARSEMEEQVTVNTQETVLALRDQLLARFAEWNTLVTVTSIAAAQFITPEGADPEELLPLLTRVMETQPDVFDVYVASNMHWLEPEGFAIFAGGWEPPADWINMERPWFLAARANPGTVGYTEPYISGETGGLAISMAKNIYDNAGRNLGVVSADVDFALFYGLIAEKIFMPDQQIFLINRQGRFITHSNPSAVLANDFFNEFRLERYRLDVLSRAYFSNIDRETFIFSMLVPGVDWLLVSIIPTAEVFAEVNRFVTAMIILAVILFAAAAAVTILFIRRKVAAPLNSLNSALNEMANGNADLTKRLPVRGNDELSQASGHFNQIMKMMQDMVIDIKDNTGSLSAICDDLASNMTETASAMNQIAANIQSIKGKINRQSASVTQTNATMEHITANIDRLNGHVEGQSGAVSESSSAIEEVLANIQSVTSTLARNAANVKELRESSETGKTSLHEVAEDIQEIARESEGLLEINAVMENIASQTNLLSMNAAIEAAHAGEAGKGFAVVADEIRKLAESSGEQSKVIGSTLKKIKDSIEKITRSTETVMNHFATIDQGVKTVVEQEAVIRSAMEEQNQGSKQILQASTMVSEITQHVKGNSVDMLKDSREVIAESRNLEQVTQEITDGMNEMAKGANEVNRAVNNVNDLSGRTREGISSLAMTVARFRV